MFSRKSTRPGPLGFGWASVNTTMFNHKINAKSSASSWSSRTYRFIKRFFELAWEFRILIRIVDHVERTGRGRGWSSLSRRAVNKSESLHTRTLNPLRQSWPISKLSLFHNRKSACACGIYISEFPKTLSRPILQTTTGKCDVGLAPGWQLTRTRSILESARIIKQHIIQLALNPPPVRPVLNRCAHTR